MNIVNLQTFLSIVETGSLVRASEQLNVTQSTVTAPLSERTNRPNCLSMGGIMHSSPNRYSLT